MPRCFLFFFNDTATTEIYTLSLHDALPISALVRGDIRVIGATTGGEYDKWIRGDPALERRLQHVRRVHRRAEGRPLRSEEHTSELQSQSNLVCRLLLEKKKKKKTNTTYYRH